MKINGMALSLGTFNKNSVEEFEKALVNISCNDADFNGENGEEYLWEEAQEKGFESNQEYLIDKVKTLNYQDAAALFLSCWLGADDYYIDYEYEIVENGDMVSIAVAYTY